MKHEMGRPLTPGAEPHILAGRAAATKLATPAPGDCMGATGRPIGG
jgi:hypothetical protein